MKVTQENLVRQLEAGNEKALEFLAVHYGGMLQGIVDRYLYLLPDAKEECLNDILLAVWENISHYDREKNTFENWLAGVAKYKALDTKRRYARRKKEEAAESIEVPAPGDLLEDLLCQELSKEVEDMLGCLKPKDKELFLKVFVEERSMGEIEQEMQMHSSQIYNHISRGKKKMRQWKEKREKLSWKGETR